MYVGHYAPALVARGLVPECRLWTLLLAAQGLDVLFDALALAGIERVEVREGVRGPLAMDLQWMPYSHSLVSALGLGAVCAAIGLAVGRRREGLAIGAVVASHWLGDLLVHGPDLHVGLGAEPRVGLGLWTWPLVGLALELGLLLGGAAFLAPRLERGRRALVRLVAAMCLVQALVAFAPAHGSASMLLAVALASNLIWPLAARRIR
jgi:hypothetical protein